MEISKQIYMQYEIWDTKHRINRQFISFMISEHFAGSEMWKEDGGERWVDLHDPRI